jgi:hypothetical protein
VASHGSGSHKNKNLFWVFKYWIPDDRRQYLFRIILWELRVTEWWKRGADYAVSGNLPIIVLHVGHEQVSTSCTHLGVLNSFLRNIHSILSVFFSTLSPNPRLTLDSHSISLLFLQIFISVSEVLIKDLSVLVKGLIFFFNGATYLRGKGPPHSRGFLITHNDAPQSVGLPWTSDKPVTETYTWQHTTLTRQDIHAPVGIRTHNPSKRAAADPRLRPRGHLDRQRLWLLFNNIMGVYLLDSPLFSWITFKHFISLTISMKGLLFIF